jgi:formylglycine-generating enzyme required for sulfatase activity
MSVILGIRCSALMLAVAVTSAACQSNDKGEAQVQQGKAGNANSAANTAAKAPQAFLDKARKNLKFVQGGSFLMGDFGPLHSPEKLYYSSAADNKPLHKVTLDSFSMAAYKITYEDYDVYAEVTGAPKTGMDEVSKKYRHPKVGASLIWQQARDYCQWLGAQLNLPMDLPTEAQWEYAARNRGEFWVVATDNGKMELGRNARTFDERSAYAKKFGLTRLEPSLPLGSLPPNPLGLYDMMTEGQEWMLDWYAVDYYAKSPEKNPQGPATGARKVLRSSKGAGGDNLIMGDGLSITRRSQLPDRSKDPEYGFPNPGFGTTSRCVVNSPAPVDR